MHIVHLQYFCGFIICNLIATAVHWPFISNSRFIILSRCPVQHLHVTCGSQQAFILTTPNHQASTLYSAAQYKHIVYQSDNTYTTSIILFYWRTRPMNWFHLLKINNHNVLVQTIPTISWLNRTLGHSGHLGSTRKNQPVNSQYLSAVIVICRKWLWKQQMCKSSMVLCVCRVRGVMLSTSLYLTLNMQKAELWCKMFPSWISNPKLINEQGRRSWGGLELGTSQTAKLSTGPDWGHQQQLAEDTELLKLLFPPFNNQQQL